LALKRRRWISSAFCSLFCYALKSAEMKFEVRGDVACVKYRRAGAPV
jgi:hypothetical protein